MRQCMFSYYQCFFFLSFFLVGLTTNDLVIHWGKQKIEFHSEHLRLPQYVMTGVDFDDCTEQHFNGQ